MANRYFIGTFPKPLDEKWRLQIPKEMQRVFIQEQGENQGLYVILGEDKGSLSIYTETGFEDLAARISTEFMTDEEARRFELEFYGQAHHVVADKQWRFVIPEPLRRKANFKGEVYLVGRKRRIDVYAPEMLQSALSGQLDKEGWPDWSRFLRMRPGDGLGA